MIEGGNREETIRLTAEALGITLAEAEFIYAIETGEIPITGDVRTVGDDRKPNRPAKSPLGYAHLVPNELGLSAEEIADGLAALTELARRKADRQGESP